MEWMIRLPGLLFSIVVHELAHGWAATAAGDPAPEREGRLTLDPIAHIDPFGTMFLPALCLLAGAPMFGWARPMALTSAKLKGREGLQVALAGPAANLSLAVCAALAYRFFAMVETLEPDFLGAARDFARFLTLANLFLAFFHLLPLHPLDGSRILAALLPARAGRAYDRLAPAGAAAVLAVLLIKPLAAWASMPADLAAALLTRVGLLG